MADTLTFEKALTDLEKIVKELESGEISLEESLKKFEEGIKLSSVCSEMLKDAKQKVEILLENADGEMTKSDFTANE